MYFSVTLAVATFPAFLSRINFDSDAIVRHPQSRIIDTERPIPAMRRYAPVFVKRTRRGVFPLSSSSIKLIVLSDDNILSLCFQRNYGVTIRQELVIFLSACRALFHFKTARLGTSFIFFGIRGKEFLTILMNQD